MGRRSSIEQLPRELQDVCHRLIREGRTIAEIREKLNELGGDVSHGAMGRYVKSAREQMTRYREAQEVASRWVEQIGENPKGDVGALCGQMFTGIVHATLDRIAEQQMAEDGKVKPMKAMDLMLLAKALQSMESTSKQSMERRAAIEKAAIERAAEKAGEVGTRAGLSQATIDEIQKELRLL